MSRQNAGGGVRDSLKPYLAPMSIRLQRAPMKSAYLQGFRAACTHGVQGVECSNHSVPTNYS